MVVTAPGRAAVLGWAADVVATPRKQSQTYMRVYKSHTYITRVALITTEGFPVMDCVERETAARPSELAVSDARSLVVPTPLIGRRQHEPTADGLHFVLIAVLH